MRLERRVGNKCTYVDFIDGHVVRAHTVNGEKGAKRIFAIMRATNGHGTSPAMRNDLGKDSFHR